MHKRLKIDEEYKSIYERKEENNRTKKIRVLKLVEKN